MSITNIKEYMKNIADNVILPGRTYDVRISIADGGVNSYIAISVYKEDFNRNPPVIQGITLHRHTNNAENLFNTWGFELGNVCNAYADNPDIVMYFGSYGKTADEAAKEAEPYLSILLKSIKKEVDKQKKEIEKSKQEEIDDLRERLKALEDEGGL